MQAIEPNWVSSLWFAGFAMMFGWLAVAIGAFFHART